MHYIVCVNYTSESVYNSVNDTMLIVIEELLI